MSFSDMLFAIPIPAFTKPAEFVKVTMCGTTYTLRAKCATTTDLESFELFNRLPRELRTKIWGLAAETRKVTAIEVRKAKSIAELTGDKKAVEYSKFKFQGAPYPSIFQVCKEVKELAGGMGYRPMFRVQGSSKIIYFHPRIDVLDIQIPWFRDGLCDPQELSKVLANPLEVQLIQQLHIPLPSFEIQYLKVIKEINAMSSLRVLHLHGEVETFATHPAFTLKLDFEDLDGKGVVPIANIPGKQLIAKDAMAAFYYYVPGRPQQDHVIHLWNVFAHLMQGTSPFPSAVKMELTYNAGLF